MYPPTIWAASDGVKIDRNRTGDALARGNAAWDGRNIKLFGARNEVIAEDADTYEISRKGLAVEIAAAHR
jgi:hypothetical protein